MLIPVFVEKKLNKEVKENIKNKKYSEEELKKIYSAIKTNLQNAKGGFIFNSIIFLLIFGFMGYKATQIRGFATTGISVSIVFYAIVEIAFYMNMTSSKRQFLKLVKENYSDNMNWE